MASSRQMRRSRRESPMNLPPLDVVPVQNEARFETNHDDLSVRWIEPRVRTPVASFEDYRGLERHGVLEHMAPLGTLPGTKVKGRIKLNEPQRRTVHLKNGELRGARDEVQDIETVPQLNTRRSESRKLDGKAGKVYSSGERDDDEDYNPMSKSSTRAVVTKSSTANTTQYGTASSRTIQGRLKLKEIVDAAVKRSRQLGNPVLGDAVNDLYAESLRNPTVAELLDAVLTQKPTPQQTVDFQSWIKAARKKHKDHRDSHSQAPKGTSTSPAARSAKSSLTGPVESMNPSSNPSIVNNHNSMFNNRPTETTPDTMEANGTTHGDERPPKRIKRSLSASSGSSLSSLDSAVDEELPPILNSSHSSESKVHHSKGQLLNGPRLGTFPVKTSDPSSRRSIPLHTHTRPSNDAADAKRREEMRRKFNQFTGVKDSAVRSSTSPILSSNSIPAVGPSARGTQHGRLRNGSAQARAKDDYEPLDSPASSNFGELLVPPPPGASRDATPNQLGRPPKALKKAARIKISPVKKRPTTTAGRGVEADSNAVSSARANNTEGKQEDDNSDVCVACSGEGMLLCCEGCYRAYHMACCDPPYEQKPLEGWYCGVCTAKHTPKPTAICGPFAGLVTDRVRKSTSSYILPVTLRNHFEGVVTGDSGEYEPEDAHTSKSRKVTRGGHEEPAENFKIRDGKEPIFCFKCGGHAYPPRKDDEGLAKSKDGRQMIQCDYCNLNWHLDCLDPPLAVAPLRNKERPNKPVWMCPNHIDHELNSINPHANRSGDDVSTNRRRWKIRRPRNIEFVETALARGVKNNGLIEIINEPSDDESSPITWPNAAPQPSRGPEKGFKLDFITQAKHRRQLEQHNARVMQMEWEEKEAAKAAEFEKRPFMERKAALNMIQLAQTADAPLSADRVRNLIGTLIAEAPKGVGDLATLDEADKPELSAEDRKDLESFIAMAYQLLRGDNKKK